MMRALLAFVLLASMLPAQAGMNWSGLWRNPDQQGEALLRYGDAAAAAKVYKDARRKAYAELKAGDYAAAARDLAAFNDSDANYNRGNALAYAGDLQGAIGAYDAALKRDPQNRDASHNRELVEKALKQQPPQQQDSNSDKSKDGKNGQQGQSSANNQPQSGQTGGKSGKGQNSSAQGNPQQQGSAGDKPKDGKQAGQQGGSQGSSAQGGKPGDQAGQNASGKSGQNGQSSPNNQTQSGQAGDHAGKGRNSSARATSGNQAMQQQSGQQQGGKGDAVPGRQAAQMTQSQGRDNAEQARRDAAASLGYAASDKQDGEGSGNETGGNAAQQPTPPHQRTATCPGTMAAQYPGRPRRTAQA